jgi:flagellar biosynthesis chaperone FliJ
MPAFKYRLQPLLEQRQRDLESAEEALIKRQNDVREAELRKEQLLREQDALSRRLRENRKGILTTAPGELLTFHEVERRKLFLKGMAEELESLKDSVFSQQLVVEEARTKLQEAQFQASQARRAVEILEKHRQKLQKRFYAELEQKEALEQDELGNVMYLMQRSK